MHKQLQFQHKCPFFWSSPFIYEKTSNNTLEIHFWIPQKHNINFNMIKVLSLLCLLTIVYSTYYPVQRYSRYPWFNRYEIQFTQQNDHFYKLFVPCSGGSGSYYYRYYDLPIRWDYRGRYLYVPKKYLTYKQRFRVKASVYDIGYRVYTRNTLQFTFTQNYKVRVYLKPFDYYAQKDVCVFPSDKKLQTQVKEGDVNELKNTIYEVFQCDTKPCSEKANFLKILLNKLKLFIGFYDVNIVDLRQDIRKLKIKIIGYREEQHQLQSAKNQLASLYALGVALKKEQNIKVFLQNRITDDKDQIIEYQASVQNSRKTVNKVNQNTNNNNRKIQLIKSNILNIDFNIAIGGQDANFLKKQRQGLVDEIHYIEQKIKELQQNIKDQIYNAKWIQQKINTLKQRVLEDQTQLKRIIFTISQIKHLIQQTQQDKMKIITRLNQLSDLIKQSQNQITRSRYEIYDLAQIIRTLLDALKQFQQTIDIYWYRCYKVRVTILQKDYGYRYYTSGVSYQNYVRKLYGYEPEEPQTEVAITDISYGSDPWKVSYGSSKYNFISNYNCSQTNLVTLKGRVSKIEGDKIFLKTYGDEEYILNCHSCSIIQSVTGLSYPRISDRAVFKGHPIQVGGNIYNVYSCIFY